VARATRFLSLAFVLGWAAPAAGQGTPGWVRFVAGAVSSVLVHEAGHVTAAAVLGGSPSVGFDHARPVIYSGLDAALDPHAQFVFSASGMSVQLLLNEVLLAWPDEAGELAGPFERGVLAGGIGTVVFYFTVGRNASVSDVQQMAQYSGLSKWTLAGIFGGVAVAEALRMVTRERYGPHFFVMPGPARTVRVGVSY